jgi:hypothetical protein
MDGLAISLCDDCKELASGGVLLRVFENETMFLWLLNT